MSNYDYIQKTWKHSLNIRTGRAFDELREIAIMEDKTILQLLLEEIERRKKADIYRAELLKKEEEALKSGKIP